MRTILCLIALALFAAPSGASPVIRTGILVDNPKIRADQGTIPTCWSVPWSTLSVCASGPDLLATPVWRWELRWSAPPKAR